MCPMKSAAGLPVRERWYNAYRWWRLWRRERGCAAGAEAFRLSRQRAAIPLEPVGKIAAVASLVCRGLPIGERYRRMPV